MEHATQALLEADLQLAEQVIAEDLRIDDLRASAEEKAFGLLALQQPSRPICGSSLPASTERATSSGWVTSPCTSPAPRDAVIRSRCCRDEVAPYFAEMGRIAVALARKAAEVIRSRDVQMAAALEDDDDAMDDLHRHMFSVLMDPSWTHGVGPAVDITLLARFYERYADHAVTVARRVVYVVTGRMPGPPLPV